MKLLLVLAQSLEQPRVVKRILKKTNEYDQVIVYGFLRHIYKVKNYELLEKHERITINITGEIVNTAYSGRLLGLWRLYYRILRKYGFKKKNIYVFGLDLRMLSFLIPNARIHYEISDIVWLYMNKTKRWFLSRIDRYLVKKSHQVIFTSKEFYNQFYYGTTPENRIHIEENKLETYNMVFPVEKLIIDMVRIAYIGAFRYDAIIENLIATVSKNKALELNFYGDGNSTLIDHIKEKCIENSNIKFHGAFKNPVDLQQIYAQNNLNFVVYDNTKENEKVAMPNKYYESGYFNIPIVCATNTYVGKRVIDNGMGWMINTDQASIQSFLDNLTIDELVDSHNRIKKLPKNLFIVENENSYVF